MRNTTRIIKCDIEEVVGKEKQPGREEVDYATWLRDLEAVREGREAVEWNSGTVEYAKEERRKRNRQIEIDLQEGKLATVHLSPLPDTNFSPVSARQHILVHHSSIIPIPFCCHLTCPRLRPQEDEIMKIEELLPNRFPFPLLPSCRSISVRVSQSSVYPSRQCMLGLAYICIWLFLSYSRSYYLPCHPLIYSLFPFFSLLLLSLPSAFIFLPPALQLSLNLVCLSKFFHSSSRLLPI